MIKMKFALVNGEKVEAIKGAKGICQYCESPVSAFCGDVYAHHWKHDKKIKCDPWWENETAWHRSWKNQFPEKWQEVRHYDKTGELHIADVKTDTDWVIEFQHSFLKPDERQSRNNFYKKLIWVINGRRRKTDIKQFDRILKEESIKIADNPPTIKVRFPEECRLFNEWAHSDSLVLFDFSGDTNNNNTLLWFLYPKMKSGNIYLSYINKAGFVELSNNDGFEKLVNDVITPMHKEILPLYEKNQRHYY